MTMTRKWLHSLTILVLALFMTQGRLLMAQSADGGGGTRDLRGLRQERRRELASVNSRAASSQIIESDRDAGAEGMAKTKGYEFRSIDYPGAYQSLIYDYNGKTAVGECFLGGAAGNAFAFQGSSYVLLNVPGAIQSSGLGINTSGDIVGDYQDSSGNYHGFLYDGSRYTTIDYPGSVATYAWDINDSGLIVGTYSDSNSIYHGFLYDGKAFTAVTFPGADNTFAYSINSSGDLVGTYETNSTHGFLLTNGSYFTIDFPEAYETHAFGINKAGAIAGYFLADIGGILYPHGFVYSNGVPIQVDVPGAINTYIYRINSKGNVVGLVVDHLDETHGIIGQ